MRSLLICILVLITVASAGAQSNQPLLARKLLIADTAAKVAAMTADSGGDARVVVSDVPLLAGPDFPAAVAPFFTSQLGLESINALGGLMKQYALKHDRVINIIVPDQPKEEVLQGVVRLVVAVNRYKDLDFKGNRWFSSKLLREKLGIKSGEEVSIARLDEAVNWANTNPFRRVQVALLPIDAQPGSTNIVVGVQERLPLRLVTSYDDSGNAVLGKRHYTGQLLYGNFLGLDHQVSYQYTTTDHEGVFHAHGLNYEVPLPWRHRLDVTANYATVDPLLFGGALNQKGKNLGIDVRYTYPLRGGNNPVELFAALDYKQNDNNLVYGGLSFGGLTDIFEVVTGISAIKRDARGGWAFGLTVNLSPGNFNSRNTDAVFQGKTQGSAFNTGRVGARAQYAYGSFSVQRVLNLDHGWQFLSRGTLQLSTANLLGSEQISIGGSATVRGFDERILTGDDGFVVSNDLQTPVIKTSLKFLPKIRPPLETRFSVFYDAGHLRAAHPTIDDLPQYPLASSGLGVHMNLGTYFNLSADYGWQISRLPPHYSSSRNRAHVKVVLAY